mmetsp:Transcript_12175/g.26182  ORF Transcript_12175/g.26182 Transcript_12175/m.26182 type:complete len:222 (+) Transcript_12175:1602-2267(+)
MHLGVQLRQVIKPWFLAHQLLVEHHGEAELQDVAVVDGQAYEYAHQLELCVHVEVGGAKPVEPGALIIREHAVVGVEQLAHQQLEELLLHSALIHALLAHKLDLEWLLECVLLLGPVDLHQRVMHQVATTPHLEHQEGAHLKSGAGREETPEQCVLQLVQLLHLVLQLQYARLAGGVKHVGVLAEGEVALIRCPPPPEVLLDIEVFIVDGVIVELRIRQHA